MTCLALPRSVLLPYCLTAPLPHCLTAPLPHCPTAPLPHCPTAHALTPLFDRCPSGTGHCPGDRFRFRRGQHDRRLGHCCRGLTIVFVALVLISLFIAMLPRVLTLIGHLWPEVEDHRALEHVESEADEDLAVLAAIGFVLHTEFQRQLGDAATSQKPS